MSHPSCPDAVEVLAPAGSPETLQAAVRAGADAVYLGGSAFSARASAKNFTNEQLRQAVEFCHGRGVQVYLTVNTLLLEEELPAALEFLRFACSLPVDALLIQDLGLFRLIRQAAPELPIHASTQMSIHTPAGARFLYEAGMERVVLARELSLKEMREIADACPVELEAFVHGALCMSVSGQCYFSAMLGGRSGNRGMCAQTCRLPFSAPSGTGHDLSLRDLSMISRMEELRRAGVCSAKIEGRMKRPEYVAAATAACRQSADGLPPDPQLLSDLESVFSRSGFTSGYPDGKLGREMFGTRTKEDVTNATPAVLARLHGLTREEYPRVPVVFSLEIAAGKPVSLSVRDEEGYEARAVSEGFPEPARTRPLDEERCLAQLQKTGGTPFFLREAHCHLEPGLSIPISLLNRLRREVLENLLEQRFHRKPYAFSMPSLEKKPHSAPEKPGIRAFFTSLEQVCEAARDCEILWLPLETPLPELLRLREEGFPIGLALPRAFFGGEESVRRLLTERLEAGFTRAWCGNLGAVALARELGAEIHGGFSLNFTNTPALQWAQEAGFASAELSFELPLEQCASLGGTLPRGILAYGCLPLMLCRNCPAANAPKGCQGCSRSPLLTDRKGASFPVRCTRGTGYRYSEVLNSVPLSLSDRQREIRGQDFVVFRFTVENPVETEAVFQAFHRGENPLETYTRGLYYRGWERC